MLKGVVAQNAHVMLGTSARKKSALKILAVTTVAMSHTLQYVEAMLKHTTMNASLRSKDV